MVETVDVFHGTSIEAADRILAQGSYPTRPIAVEREVATEFGLELAVLREATRFDYTRRDSRDGVLFATSEHARARRYAGRIGGECRWEFTVAAMLISGRERERGPAEAAAWSHLRVPGAVVTVRYPIDVIAEALDLQPTRPGVPSDPVERLRFMMSITDRWGIDLSLPVPDTGWINQQIDPVPEWISLSEIRWRLGVDGRGSDIERVHRMLAGGSPPIRPCSPSTTDWWLADVVEWVEAELGYALPGGRP